MVRRGKAEPYLYEQLIDSIMEMIRRGVLRPGDRLPSIRNHSRQARVSISTVLQAYLSLEARGAIEVKPQSGFYVNATEVKFPEPRPTNPRPIVTRIGVNELLAKVFLSSHDQNVIQFGVSTPGPEYLPVKRLSRLVSAAVRNKPVVSVSYDFPPGYPPLRREIAKRSIEYGCILADEDIVTTAGAMEAINLCLRAVAKAGDAIVIETPTFYGTLQAIESLGMKALEIATDPREGIILDSLTRALKKERVKACLLVPNFNNPLGSCMPEDNKKELVRILAQREIPLIEDDICGDLYFGSNRPKPAKAYDKEGLVLLCSSFSKTLAPGYRVGWTAPGIFKARVESLKFMTSMATPTVTQIAIAEFLMTGAYDRYLRKLRGILAQQVHRMRFSVSQYFPRGTRITRPQGGLVLWIELPRSIDSLELQQKALRENISIAPGPIFSAKQKYSNFVRLSCGQMWSEKVDLAVKRLGEIMAKQ